MTDKKLVLVDLPEEVFNKMQRLTYEVSTTQYVVNMFLTDHIKDPTPEAVESPVFKKYQQQYIDLSIKFDQEKEKITEEFVPDELKSESTTWNINFKTRQLEITVFEGDNCNCGKCNCK